MKIKEKEFEAVLDDLKALAVEMGAKVRFERGDFKGGYCLVKDSKIIVINKLSTTQRKVITLSAALTELGIDDVYLPPKLRSIIEEMDEMKTLGIVHQTTYSYTSQENSIAERKHKYFLDIAHTIML